MTRRGASALFTLLAAFVVAPPALADGPTGFFVAVEARFLQPSGLDTGYVLNDPEFDFEPEGRVENVEFSNELSAKLWLGQSRGQSGWAVSYWSFDEDRDDSTEAALTGELWTTLFPPDLSLLGTVFGPARASVGVEADTTDAIYWRRAVDKPHVTLSWFAGLRYASLDTRLFVRYDDFGDVLTVDLASEAQGVGMTGGARGSLRLGQGFFVDGGLGYSLLRGSVESSTFTTSTIPLFAGARSVERDEDRGLTILDLSLALSYRHTDTWVFSLGYELSQWSDALDRNVFPDDVNAGLIDLETSDVTFDGFKLGVAVMF